VLGSEVCHRLRKNDTQPQTTTRFTSEAVAVLHDLDEYRVKMCNNLERFGMDALPGRLHEMTNFGCWLIAAEQRTRAATLYVVGVFINRIGTVFLSGEKKRPCISG
jgi:hypothetical protein